MEANHSTEFTLEDFQEIESLINNLPEAGSAIEFEPTANLKTILATIEELKAAKSKQIVYSKPLLRQGENAFLYPRTIAFIQGQTGTHKSRLAETICSALLRKPGCENELLGFNTDDCGEEHVVVYVDTERNTEEQFPDALQSIQIKAGYKSTDHPENFKYLSLFEIDTNERFKALDEYLTFLKLTITKPFFIVLDVMTDCLADFNNIADTQALMQMIKLATKLHKASVLCLIHENPKSDKARGHLGTEGHNKSTTTLQVSFIKNQENKDSDLIEINYLKCRRSKRYPSYYAQYSEELRGLVLADQDKVDQIAEKKAQSTKGFKPAEIPDHKHIERLNAIFSHNPKPRMSDLISQIDLAYGVKTNLAKSLIQFWVNKGWVKQEGKAGTISSFYTR